MMRHLSLGEDHSSVSCPQSFFVNVMHYLWRMCACYSTYDKMCMGLSQHDAFEHRGKIGSKARLPECRSGWGLYRPGGRAGSRKRGR